MTLTLKNVILRGDLTDIVVEDGIIKSIGKTNSEGVEFGGLKIFPGLIDTHSHGCMGEDTMDVGLEGMARWELSHGTTTWYPTTMTMSVDDIVAATEVQTEFEDGANIPGFHMEGPFINPKFKGAQDERHVLAPSMEIFNKCKKIKKVTIAPEAEGGIEFIKECPAVVSLGHTAADYDTVMKAFEAGARSLTHTYNVMPGIHHRAPGPIGAASDFPEAYCELICDGYHIHPSAVRMLVKIVGEDRVTLVSDSIAAAGLSDGEYTLGGLPVFVKDRKALTEGGNLAGSTFCLFDCVRVAISMGFSEDAAVKMASENPARLMGLNKGKIEVGFDADFILVDEKFNLVKVVKGGKIFDGVSAL